MRKKNPAFCILLVEFVSKAAISGHQNFTKFLKKEIKSQAKSKRYICQITISDKNEISTIQILISFEFQNNMISNKMIKSYQTLHNKISLEVLKSLI